MRDDVQLLEAWAAGDNKAGNELFERHFRAIFGFFRAKISGDVDDLVQQTFMRCVEHHERFEGRSSFRTYLFGMARNILFETLRKQRRDAAAPNFETQSLVDLSPSPSRILIDKKDRRMLLEAMRRIPLDYQIALELYHWEGLTAVALGEILGLGEPGVRSRLRRATAALRRELATVVASAQQLDSTMAGLSDWAAEMREQTDGTEPSS